MTVLLLSLIALSAIGAVDVGYYHLLALRLYADRWDEGRLAPPG